MTAFAVRAYRRPAQPQRLLRDQEEVREMTVSVVLVRTGSLGTPTA